MLDAALERIAEKLRRARWLDDVLRGGRGAWWFGNPVYPA
jgi:hypothetical protein